MELLTLLAAARMLAMMAAIHGRAPDERKTVGAIAFAFMILNGTRLAFVRRRPVYGPGGN